ncbi:MAG: immunoglobulin domain-containing protein [Verrucomicrobiota bacterium]
MQNQIRILSSLIVAFSAVTLHAQVPTITSQPQSQRTTVGSDVTFNVAVDPVFPTVSSGTLRLWLKADSGVVTNANGLLSQWQDQSGNTNHASQSNTNLQPSLVHPTAIGNRAAVRFDGIQNASVGDYLQGTGDVGLSDAYTSFMVYSVSDSSPGEELPSWIGTHGTYGAGRGNYISSQRMAFATWTYDYPTTFIIPTNTYRIWTDRFNTNRTLIELFDSTLTTSTNFSLATSGQVVPAPGYYVGGLNALQTPGRNFAGDIAELIYFRGSLSESDRVAVETYLKQKYYQSGGSSGSVTFQWQYNGTNIVGATNSSLTLTNVQLADEGYYSAIASNSFGPTTSSNALLTFSAPPTITAQPQSEEVIQGTNVSFSVSASGAFSLSYQWRFNGVGIPGATNSTLSLSNVQPANAGTYSTVVTDGITPIVSSNATLIVDFAPSITGQPQSKSAFTGMTVTFSVAASGYPLSYQWFFNSSNIIIGATNASLVLTNLQTNNAGNYSVLVTNNFGSAASSNALLTVINTSSPIFEDFEPDIHTIQWTGFSPTVLATNYGGFVSATHSLWFGGSGSRFATTRPINVSGGGSISFYLRLGNGPPPLWETVDLPAEGIVLEYSLNGSSWTNMGTYNTSTYFAWTLVQPAIPVGAQSSGTFFRWRQLSNSGPSNDHWALDDIQIVPASSSPIIITQPQNQTVFVGANATLDVAATGQNPLSYQWLFNSSTVLSSTNSSLTLSNVQPADAGNYSVIITNLAGAVTSSIALVTVTNPPPIPRIDSFSPMSGPVGATVTIVGGNFSSIASNNIVWFGAVAAPVVAATQNQLTILVPTNASQSPISVLVNGYICVAASPFVVTYVGTGTFSASSLAAAINLPSGNTPIGVKIVDLDGDGKPDLVVANNTENTISVYRNIGTNGSLTLGSFAPRINFAVGASPRHVTIGDIDGDGKRDIVVANNGGSTVSVFRNISNPGDFTVNSLAPKVDFSTGTNPNQLALVDLNGDGKLDLATANSGTSTLSIFRNTASVGSITASSFAARVDFPAGAQSSGLAVADIDGDGKPDLALSNISGNSISLFGNTTPVGNAAITFAPKVDFATPGNPFGGMSIGDLDGDGKLDIAVATYTGGTVSVFRNISTTGVITTNSLAARFDLPTGGSTHGVVTVDIDGDGKSDLVAVSEYANAVAVFQNLSTNGTLVAGSFAPRVDFATASNPGGVAVGDLDGDGRPDVVAAASYGNVLSIFRNLNGPQAPTGPAITSQPTNRTVVVGANISLTVTATGSQPLTYQWLFNGTNISNATNSSLTLSNAQPSNSGNYSVFITNSISSVTSSNATVTVLVPPAITIQPQDQSVLLGSNVTFTVTTTGTSLRYQWRFNGTSISNATSSSYLIASAQPTNGGGYSVVITNAVGSVTSSVANLTVVAPPAIVSQPQSQSVVAGTNVTFSVGLASALPTVNSGTLRLWLKADSGVVTNGNGLISQWQDQSGNTNHAFQSNTNLQPVLASASAINGRAAVRFDGTQIASTGDFMQGIGDVGIPDAYTSFLVYSISNAGLGEELPAWIGAIGTYGAGRGYYIRNQKMAFATWSYDYGSGFILPTNTYRIWTDRFNTNRTLVELFDSTATSSTNINLATSGQSSTAAGYFIGGLNPSETPGRNFSGDITELIYFRGSLSETDRVTVETYLKQKYYQSGGSSGSVTFQWQYNGTNIVGATNSSLTLSNVQPANAGNYSVVVANSAGSTTSANASLTVNVPPSITAQPQNQAVNAGTTATFNVTATGTTPLGFQWQKNSNNLANATNSSLVLTGVQTSDAGNYRVIVSSPFGSVTSSNAALTVNISTVRVVSANGASAASFTLPIELLSVGTENAVGFSLTFDPTILTFDSISVASNLSGAVLISNTSQLGSGKLGVAVALSANNTFVAGTNALVQIVFNVAVVTNALNTSLDFGDSPTVRQISDANAETLPSTYVGGTVAISAVDFEGDVAPRPNGSRTLTIVDWVQVGRFAAGLDTVTNSAEFQRADCAPRSTLGNGAISITDWVQAGRYATGVDPLTPVGGPTTAAAKPAAKSGVLTASDFSRVVDLQTTNATGQTHFVFVRLVAQGDENAMGLSLSFDPTLLTFVSATTGGNASGALLNVNTNSVSAGRVGAALSLSVGSKFAIGTQEVIKLTFAAAPYATGSTPLTFGDSPVFREVSDSAANSLPASYNNASLMLSIPGPLLTIARSPEGIVLSWPSSATNFALESSSPFGTNWSGVAPSLTTNGQTISTTLPMADQQRWFRLKK